MAIVECQYEPMVGLARDAWDFNAEAVADRIRLERDRRGLRGKELAALAGVDPGQLSRLLSGAQPRPTAEMVARLAHAMNVSADYLLGLTAPPSLHEPEPAKVTGTRRKAPALPSAPRSSKTLPRAR